MPPTESPTSRDTVLPFAVLGRAGSLFRRILKVAVAAPISRVGSLGSTRATQAYYGSVALLVTALFVPALPPMVDYPQHLALADAARRLMLGDPSAAAQFSTHWFTYNALFHLLTSLLSLVVSTDLAGRLVVASSLIGLAIGLVLLLRALGRPPVYASLLVPSFFSFSLAWGFINYALGVTLVVLTCVCVVHSLSRAGWKTWVGTWLLGLLCGFTHVLASLALCLFALALAPELAWAAAVRAAPGGSLGARIAIAVRRAAWALLPLSGGAIYCTLVFLSQYHDNPESYRDATLEGNAPPLWAKVLQFGGYATGVHLDQSDTALVWVSVLFMVLVIRYRRREAPHAHGPTEQDPMSPAPEWGPVGPILALSAAYFAVPEVFIGTHLVFPRLAQLVLIGAALTLPRMAGAQGARLEKWLAGLAVASGVNLLIHSTWHAWETNGAAQVVRALPPGRRATAVLYEPASFAFQCATLAHWAAYYGAWKGGDWAFSFARFSSLPLSIRDSSLEWPRYGWEFAPSNYDPRCQYARTYDLVLVAAPRSMADADEAEIRNLVFKADAGLPQLLARSGRFLAFDTEKIQGATPAGAGPGH